MAVNGPGSLPCFSASYQPNYRASLFLIIASSLPHNLFWLFPYPSSSDTLFMIYLSVLPLSAFSKRIPIPSPLVLCLLIAISMTSIGVTPILCLCTNAY